MLQASEYPAEIGDFYSSFSARYPRFFWLLRRWGSLCYRMFARFLYGYFQTMWQEEENTCFQEVDVVKRKNLEAVEAENMEDPPKCIVEHPGFQSIWRNLWVLQATWQYKQKYGASAYEGSHHKKSRHIVYRQLIRWCWDSLGKDIRVTLPSCAVNCIPPHFQKPERLEDEMEYTFHYADE